MTKSSKSSTKSKGKVTKTIEGKAIGRNVILNIDGTKYSKAFPKKEDREEILSLVDAYNKRNSLAKEKAIIDFMLKDKSTEADRKAEASKKVGKSDKKITKKAPISAARKKTKKDTLIEAKKLLEEDGYIVTKKAPPSRRRGGEY